ncbi:sensor domain-containing protein [Qipengyuania flava]|uniref:sensor domain-containing protein n=1 Tax=Qipengyuania flava TaxID=192812 RepID=UPI00273DD9EA|nr:EAL domain-containing protein [Qipengyuania flava]
MAAWGVDRLGEVVEKSASEVYLFDPRDCAFILVNKGARDNLGYSAAELAKLHPWDLKPEFDEQQFRDFVAPLLNGETKSLSFETAHKRKDGSTYDVSVKLQLIETGGETVFFAAIQDVSDLNFIRQRFERTTRQLDSILHNTQMAIFMMDEHQQCSFMNRAAELMTGYSFDEAAGRCLHDLIHHHYPDGSPFPIEECPIDQAFPERHLMTGEDVFIHKDGQFFNVAYTASPIIGSEGEAIGTVVEVANIDAEIGSREELARSHAALEKSVRIFKQAEKIAELGSWEFNTETQELHWSDETYRILGLEPDGSITLERSLQLYAPEDRSRVEALYLDAIRNKHSLNFTTHVVRSGGDFRQIRVMAEFVEEPNGDQIVMIGTIHDVTDKLRAMSDLHYAAAHDDLTGLLNRNAFEEGARERLRQALMADASFFALLFDLTGFKFVNDTFGHQTGDKLLQQIGGRIAKAAPDHAIVSRWGGDEFAILSPLAMSESQARTLGQNILKAIATAVDLEEGVVSVGATCGIAQSTALSSLEDLIRRADLALYHGKAREPGRLHFYNPGMELRNSERRIALQTVESALGEDRVQAGYQPIIQLTDNRLIGFEALLRINGNGRSVIPAGDVIPAIVDPVISRQISERMFENVSRDLPGLMAEHAGVQYVSINATEADLISRDFASRVLRVLEQHGVDPTCVTVEITETMLLVGNNQNVKSVLEELRSHGIRIALDDFGTGYSSLTHLRDFPIDRLKIDASFVQDICFSPTSKNIVQAMVVMGRSMGIEVIAEGIEAEEQRSALLDIGCYYGQGYLFSPAVPAEKARAFQFGYSDRETA